MKLLAGAVGAVLAAAALLTLTGATSAQLLLAGTGPALCVPTDTNSTETKNSRQRLTTQQRRNARLIIRVGTRMGLPRRAAVIAIAAAYQESRLRNLHHGHLDSLGLFQQRPSAGWGTPQQILNPRYATRQFYTTLTNVPGWRRMPISAAAQAVQRSAYPDAYAQWANLARRIVTRVSDSTCPTGPGPDGNWPEQHMLPMGLTPRTLQVMELIQKRFNEHNIGGYCPGGCTTGHVENSDHYDGHAIDVMITPYTDPARVNKGWQITNWLVTNHEKLAIKYVIYQERIWTGDEGWHPYTHPSGNTADPTLRHLDHIHVSVY